MDAVEGRRGPRLLAELRGALRLRHYSRRTEEAYVAWVRRFVRFVGMRHPRELGEAEVRAFLSHLADPSGLSAASQNQAASALLFLYEHVVRRPMSPV
ncbi:MAG: site-specific integrase, partial [Gemmatimonadales bacterium]